MRSSIYQAARCALHTSTPIDPQKNSCMPTQLLGHSNLIEGCVPTVKDQSGERPAIEKAVHLSSLLCSPLEKLAPITGRWKLHTSVSGSAAMVPPNVLAGPLAAR